MLLRFFFLIIFFSLSFVVTSQSKEKIEELCAHDYNDVISDLVKNESEYKEALAYAKEHLMEEEAALLNERLALINYYLQNVEEGLEYSLEAVSYYEQQKDYRKVANIYADLGYAIKHVQLDRGLEYFRKAIKITEDHEVGKDLGKFYNNYGTLLGIAGDLDSALYYHLESLEVCYQFNDTIGIPYSLNNAAVIYSQLGQFEKAFNLLDQSDALRKLENNDLSWADNLAYRADIYFEQQSYDSAVKYYEKALDLSKKSKFVNLITFSLERLSTSYEKMNNAEKALYYYKELKEHKDSVVTVETNAAIAALQEEFNAAEKQKKIAEQSLELAEQDLEIERKEVRELYILILIAGLLVIAGWVVYIQLRKRKTERLKLEHAKELEKAELEKQFVEEKLRIGRELHDNIGSQLTFMISSVDNLSYLEKEEKKLTRLNKIGDFGRNTMKELRTTIWAMKNDGGTLHDLILRINELKRSVQEVVIIEVENNVDDQMNLNALEMLNFYRVIQEFVQNTIKYANATKVLVKFLNEGNELTMMLEDDGEGFDVEKHKFSGNGLGNMKKRCVDCNGKFEISSGKGGTKVKCVLPR